MRWFIKENDWSKRGWGNGYVVLDKDHPFYGLHCDDIDVDVHGSLTFGKYIDQNFIDSWEGLLQKDLDKYIIGFDTAHSGDTLENWSKENVEAETIDLFLQCYWVNPENEKGEE